MHLCKMVLLAHMGQFRLGSNRFVPAASQMGLYFLGNNQEILLLIKSRNFWTESSQ